MNAVPVANPVTSAKNVKSTLSTVINVGKMNGAKTWWQILLLSWHGGVFIAFGAAVGCAIAGTLDTMNVSGTWPDSNGNLVPVSLHISIPVALLRIAVGATFSMALNFIVLTGFELFTGNVMFVTASRWAEQITWVDLGKDLLFSLLGNISGALTVAYFLIHLTNLYEAEPIKEFVLHNAHNLVYEGTFGIMVLKGVGDNYLIGLALWGCSASDDVLAKFVAMWWPVLGFVCIGFEHSIATSFFVPVAMMIGSPITVSEYLVKCLIPVAIGNVIGGALFATAQYWLHRPLETKLQVTQTEIQEVATEEIDV